MLSTMPGFDIAYTLKGVANLLDIHYTTVSKIIRNHGTIKTDNKRPDPMCTQSSRQFLIGKEYFLLTSIFEMKRSV